MSSWCKKEFDWEAFTLVLDSMEKNYFVTRARARFGFWDRGNGMDDSLIESDSWEGRSDCRRRSS